MTHLPRDYSGVTHDSDLIALWLLNRPEQTQRSYRRDAARFLAFVAPKSIPDLTVKDVGDWVASIGDTNSKNTLVRRLTNVKSLLSFAKETGYCVFNVGGVIRLPKMKRRTPERVSTGDAVRGMAAEADAGRDRILIRFIYATGCRVSEAVGVNFGDVRIKRGPDGQRAGMVTLFGKGQKTRDVPFSLEVAQEVLALKQAGHGKDTPVFRNFVNGKRLSVRSVQRLVASVRLPGNPVVVTPHVLRHTHSLEALQAGAKVEELQHQLGHSDLSTTTYYTHLLPGQGTGSYIIV